MYCKKCYAFLDPAEGTKCGKCGRPFDPENPHTYLAKPFPSKSRIAQHLILTTILSVAAAFAVAIHQAMRTSGH
jgi:hypothetical protein